MFGRRKHHDGPGRVKRGSLIVRKRRDGTRTFEGPLPDEHVFSAHWINRELGDLCRVTLTVTTTDGDVSYAFEGFEHDSNFTGWRCRRED